MAIAAGRVAISSITLYMMVRDVLTRTRPGNRRFWTSEAETNSSRPWTHDFFESIVKSNVADVRILLFRSLAVVNCNLVIDEKSQEIARNRSAFSGRVGKKPSRSTICTC